MQVVTPNLDIPQRLSRKKRFLFAIIISSFTTMSLLFLGEMIMRRRVGPWVFDPAILSLEPPGTYNLKDSALGYSPRPGKVKVTLAGPYSFTITHLPNGLRITHPLDTYPGESKQEIWIFGCSLTEGWTVNDADTYPWLLQEKLRRYEVVNFGVGGNSTVQSLIQFREALQNRKRPPLVILSYASIHDPRNTLAPAWRKRITNSAVQRIEDIRMPYVRQSGDTTTEILYESVEYHEVPFARYSALANSLDDTYNRLLGKTYHSHDVSKVLIEEFSNLCKANRIDFIVAGIGFDSTTAEMLEYCKGRGIATVDISVDPRIKENTNLPYDAHPSAVANRQYAQKLAAFLSNQGRFAKLFDWSSQVAK